MNLQVENLSFAYNGSGMVLRNVDMKASPGEITALLGPNASGKSTLLKCIAGILKPQGNIRLEGKELRKFKAKDISTYVSYLPQEHSSRAVLTVFEAVLLGRLQYLSWKASKNDLTLVLNVLEEFGIEDLASRYLNELSGGQKQMVSIAQAIVRRPQVLLLDEPVTSLDLQHELEILQLIRHATTERGTTTVIALHNLNLAARFADNVVVLKDGEICAIGKPQAVLTPEMVKFAYSVNAVVKTDDGILQITPLSSIRDRA